MYGLNWSRSTGSIAGYFCNEWYALAFKLELFEVRVLVLVIVVVLVRGGQIYFKCLLCVSSHSNDFIVLAKKKIINCQNRTD